MLSVVLAILAVVYAGLKVNGFVRRTGGLCCEFHVSCNAIQKIKKSLYNLTIGDIRI